MELNAITRWNSISADLYRAHAIAKKRAAGEIKDGQHVNIDAPKTGYKTRNDPFGSTRNLHSGPSSNDLADRYNHDDDYDDDVDESSEEDNTGMHVNDDKKKSISGNVPMSKVRDILNNPQSSFRRGRYKLSEQIEQLKMPDGTHTNSSMVLEVIYRFIRRFTKGFAIGYIGKATLSMIGLLIKTKGNINKLRAPVARLIVGDPVGYGVSVGGFIATFETIYRLTRYWRGYNQNTSVRSLVAGGLAGLTFFAMPADARVGISLFVLVRAIEVLCRYVSNKYPALIPEIIQNNAAPLTMGIASAQNLWAWLFNRKSVDSSYNHFLDHHSQKNREQLDAITHLYGGTLPTHGPIQSYESAINKCENLRAKRGVSGKLDLSHANVQCGILHPECATCWHSAAVFFVEALKRSVPVYAPVYLIPLILFKYRAIVKRPIKTASSTAYSIGRSSAFLATYCTIAMHSICAVNQATGIKSPYTVALAGFAGGFLGLLVERDGRRIELALYVLSHAILSFYRTWHGKGLLPAIKHGEVMVFSASMAVMMWSYINHPYTVRYSYFSLFRFLFGSGGAQEKFVHPKGMSIKHTARQGKPRIAAQADMDVVQ